MLNVSKDTNQPRKRTPRRISLLTFSLLMCLIENNLFIKSWLVKKNKTTKKVFSTAKDKNKIAATTPLPKMPILFLKKKKKIFPTSYTSITKRRAIFPKNISRRGTRSQKTSDNFCHLHIDKINVDSILEATLEHVICIWYPIWFWKDKCQF